MSMSTMMAISRVELAAVLLSLDSSVVKTCQSDVDLNNAFAEMMKSVPEENHVAVKVAYLNVQSILIESLATQIRDGLHLDPKDPLLCENSTEARAMFFPKPEETV